MCACVGYSNTRLRSEVETKTEEKTLSYAKTKTGYEQSRKKNKAEEKKLAMRHGERIERNIGKGKRPSQ